MSLQPFSVQTPFERSLIVFFSHPHLPKSTVVRCQITVEVTLLEGTPVVRT